MLRRRQDDYSQETGNCHVAGAKRRQWHPGAAQLLQEDVDDSEAAQPTRYRSFAYMFQGRASVAETHTSNHSCL